MRRTALAGLAVVLLIAVSWHFLPGAAGQAGAQASLAADGSLGKVVDREGTAQVRPRNQERWRIAQPDQRLMPGDWVRTGSRGANAIVMLLTGDSQLTLGPAALVELVEPDRIALLRGDIEVAVAEDATLQVVGPGGQSRDVTDTRVLRARDDALEVLDDEPRWLVGYKSDAATEAMGSLLANVDGRNVPLTMGYHKVSVDIRDQIARTVVDETFINHSSQTLEGVFYFPLPADASISGFAMWIGGEKVEGEIVEKQRAREIYETILREKRDPGLLEWTGGNIFKARVFPIHSQKRIQITYTQVLPKVGDTYRYNYALRSDLTRLTPLEQLEMRVTISSAQALAKVECTTHPCRIDATDNAARVEFSAQDYTPTRDFEIRVQCQPTQETVSVIPHLRGDDGYLMLLVDVPSDLEGLVGRTPAGEPLDCILIVDTSGSMEGAQRAQQIAFVDAFLGGLAATDRFQLATLDTEMRWASDDAHQNTRAKREAALRFVEERRALGWTPLRLAFEEAFERAGPRTQIVYVGDGIVTQGNTDPAAFLTALQRVHSDRGVVHTVAVGSTHDALVMQGLSQLGSGTTRSLGSSDADPALAADHLLRELVTPVLRDLQLHFTGIDVAAVHPQRLPNLVAGTQGVVVARYDPDAVGGPASVRVTGRSGTTTVEFDPVVLDLEEADRGNSFIPRLWARRHLDHLLLQGRTIASLPSPKSSRS
jgi:hypothetical protein